MRRSCIAGFWHKAFLLFSWVNRSPHGLGKWRTEFRTDEFWFRSVIAFTICLSQFRLRKNGCESLKIIFKNTFEDMKSEFPPGIFQQGKYANAFSDVPFVSRIFHWNVENNPKLSYLVVSLVKHQSVLLVCFNESYIESCSSFMIHTRCHTSI